MKQLNLTPADIIIFTGLSIIIVVTSCNLFLTIINNNKTKKIMLDFTSLNDAVSNETTLDNSIITLLDQIAEQVTSAGTDQAKLDDVVATIKGNSQNIVDAIKRRTPADPAYVAPVPVDGSAVMPPIPPIAADKGTTGGGAIS